VAAFKTAVSSNSRGRAIRVCKVRTLGVLERAILDRMI
jgi:hypothetical protein